MPLQLFIGQPKLNGALAKYASRYNLLELRADQAHLPREAVLRRWAEETPDGFAFSMLLTSQCLQTSGESSAALDRALMASQALKAKWLIVQTDPMWGPSQKMKQRLTSVLQKLLDSGVRVGWEPHGVWQDDEAFGFARQAGVTFVRDIGRGDPLGEDVIYSRMPGLGIAARMSIGTMERVAKNVGEASEAYIVVAGEGARKLQQLLPDLVSRQQQGLGGHSMVETFGGFAGSASAEELEELEELEEEQDEESDGFDDESEIDEDADGAEYDSELDDEDELEEEDEEPEGNGGSGQRDSKWEHDHKKRTKERDRR